jgi:hypothetical protein
MTDIPKSIEEAFGPAEELDPELAAHRYTTELGWDCIKHPWVFSIHHHDAMNHMVNQQLAYKREAIGKAMENKQWHSFVFLHERAYRVDGFKQIAKHMSDEQYWDLLSNIWRDSENIRERPKVWERLLRSNRPGREHMMDEEEREQLAAMDDTIEVFQGHTDERDDGWSWTIQLETAQWFAYRFADFEHATPVVSYGVVDKDNVVAYLTGRNEAEILVPRSAVKITGVKPLKPREGTFNDARPIVNMILTTSNNTTTTVTS